MDVTIMGKPYDSVYAAKAILFYEHMESHEEVKKSPTCPGIPMCTICEKNGDQIINEFLKEKGGAEPKKLNFLVVFSDSSEAYLFPSLEAAQEAAKQDLDENSGTGTTATIYGLGQSVPIKTLKKDFVEVDTRK